MFHSLRGAGAVRPARLLLGISLLLNISPAFAPPSALSAPAAAPLAPAAPTSLLDRARVSAWRAPAGLDPSANPKGYQENDILYLNGLYYLFATGGQDPAWVDVYVGRTPDELVRSQPAFRKVAPIRYPTVVKEGNTWHMWGVNPPHRWTEHWISRNADPTGFVYSDSPFLSDSLLPVVDFAVRRRPGTGTWYGVGFETETNAPLLLTRAASPYGPWEKLNYVSYSPAGGIFGDTGAPPWASAARPDPNLAFTSDGRAWVFFTGSPTTLQPPTVFHRSGMVEVDVGTGKAIGNPVVLFNPAGQADLPFDLTSDLNLISVPGQPTRVFGYTHNPAYPLAVLDVAPPTAPSDGRATTDLVRLDMARGRDVATGMIPAWGRSPYRWRAAGLVVPGNFGGVGGYLDEASLGDLSFRVDFTPTLINKGARNTVAFISGPDAKNGPILSVQVDATGPVPLLTAFLRGNDDTQLVLTSPARVDVNQPYAVLVHRMGSQLTLEVNGQVAAQAVYAASLTGLESWSLANAATLIQPARDPFQGVIHAFVVTGSR